LVRARQPVEALESVDEKMVELEGLVVKPVERVVEEIILPQRRSLRLGDKVRLRTLATQGIVTALGEEDVEVSVGMLRIRTRLADLDLAGRYPETAAGDSTVHEKKTSSTVTEKAGITGGELLPASPGMELDLRGQRAEDAVAALDRYLDSAYLAGLPFVRIIHGKGTGRLREVVRETLSHHPQVRSFEAGGDKEGGEGVTVIKLAGK
jgi:DNA mismatch repair protein MutS2